MKSSPVDLTKRKEQLNCFLSFTFCYARIILSWTIKNHNNYAIVRLTMMFWCQQTIALIEDVVVNWNSLILHLEISLFSLPASLALALARSFQLFWFCFWPELIRQTENYLFTPTEFINYAWRTPSTKQLRSFSIQLKVSATFQVMENLAVNLKLAIEFDYIHSVGSDNSTFLVSTRSHKKTCS